MSQILPRPVISLEDQGARPPLCALEAWFNWAMGKLLLVSALLAGLLLIPVTLDVILRPISGGLHALMDIESMALVTLAFIAMAYSTVTRKQVSITLLYDCFSEKNRHRLDVFGYSFSLAAALLMAKFTWQAVMHTSTFTSVLRIDHSIFVGVTSVGFGTMAIALVFQLIHSIRDALKGRDISGIVLALALTSFMYAIPYLYKASGFRVSTLVLGGIAMLVLLTLFMLHIPIGIAMMGIAYIGLMCIMRTPKAVGTAIGPVPFHNGSDFVYLALPMFMLMGEIMTMGGISDSIFRCSEKWLGRVPGGLACATVGGCAGFGAVCGESLATVITMSNVALKPMRNLGYDMSLATGTLAAGGTLGILIPPSMGFIFYSIMTEESVGKLFAAGIIPGSLLASIFISIIVFRCIRNPNLAPPSAPSTMEEKLRSLVGLLPVVLLFVVVVIGILQGFFTPGEGGAVGAACGLLYSFANRTFSIKGFSHLLYNTAAMCSRIFVIMAGVFIFGVFLTSSRLPTLLAQFVIELEVNRYLILGIMILIYILLGFVMNIIPMMMFTLPSIYPTIQALGFDGIWFGVITVIVMEMGMITPPVGINVFTMASLVPEVPMGTIFKGVMPFFLGMCLCVLLVILFPQLALFLV